MARNGSGTFARTNGVHTGNTLWTDDRDAGSKILADRHDLHDQDLADGITQSLSKDGQTPPTANLPMATFKHTNVAASAARTDYVRVAELQDGGHCFEDADTGAADAYAIAPAPAITAYVAGQLFRFKAVNANTGASTLAVSGLAVKPIKRNDGTTALAAGDIAAGSYVEVQYDGTNFRLLNSPLGTSTQAAALSMLGAFMSINHAGPAGTANSGGIVTDTTITDMSVTLTVAANQAVILVSVVPVSISSAGTILIRHFRDAVRCTADTYVMCTPATTGTGGQTDSLTLISYDAPAAGSYTYTTKWTNSAGTAYSTYPVLMRLLVPRS